jgi:hypothetical protein
MRSRAFFPVLLLLAFVQAAFAQIQLIQDGGFESPIYTPPWYLSGTGVVVANGSNPNGGGPYDGAQYLSLGNANGAVGNAYQIVTFPTNLIGATLSLHYQTLSTNPLGDDQLSFSIENTSGNVLIPLASTYSAYTTANDTSGYAYYTTNFITYPGSNTISSYAGQTVMVVFSVQTDPTYGSSTSFGIDDVSLLAGTTADIPPNDNFTNATVIPAAGITNGFVTNTYASKEPGEPNHAGNAGGHSVWWVWTAPAIGTVNINTTGSSFETLLAVYASSSPANPAFSNLTCVVSNNGAADNSGLASLKFTVPAEAQVGTTYYIALDGHNGASGSAVFDFTFTLDTTPPKILSFSPATGAVVTNSSLPVSGTASDNVAVASVQYRLTNAAGIGAWQLASTTNQWTNWSGTVTNLIAGQNTVTVEAIDTSTNVSALVSHVFNYEIKAPLALSIVGQGVISGATNGQLLDIGYPYKITARTNGGFAFTGWTGSLVTNSASLSFIMAPGLSLTANFADVTKPTLKITAPTAGQRWSNSTFSVMGTANDNVAVASVYYQLNTNNWTNATSGNLWTNWTAIVTLIPGTNTLRAYSEDTSGNLSPTANVVFLYIPSDKLTVQTNGNGTVAPNDNGKLLAIGTNYTLTASAGKNWIFSTWVASGSESFVNNAATLNFTMQSNLVLTANFVTNVFLAAQGTYNGLFAPDGAPRQQTNSGAITLTVTSTGVLSGKLTIGSSSPSLTGQFNPAGAATIVTPRKGLSTLTTTLQLDFAGQTVGGSVTDGSFVAPVMADLAVFSATHTAANYEGQYTFVIPGTNDEAAGPAGTSCGTATVSPAGAVTFAVTLADGTSAAVNPAGVVSKDGFWPFYLPLYGGNGSLWSWNSIANGALMSAPGASWINATNPSKTALYRAGFTNEAASIIGSAYSSTAKPLLELTNGQVILEGGNLPFIITNQVTLTLNNTILTNASDTNKLILTINTKTGGISGTFANPSNPKQLITNNGVLLQNQTNAQGFFPGTTQSGAFTLLPQ